VSALRLLVRDSDNIAASTDGDLEVLSRDTRLVLLIDGLNEIGEESRDYLLQLVRRLTEGGCCYVVATDRLGVREWDSVFTRHALLDGLRSSEVERVWRAAGRNDFSDLPKSVRRALSKPFFLHMALGSGKAGQRLLLADFFQDFFAQHSREGLGLASADLDGVATACVLAFADDGSFRTSVFEEAVDQRVLSVLTKTGVWRGDAIGFGFEHDLWRDFFVARALAADESLRTYRTLDLVTTFAKSLECLPMTAEQTPSMQARDEFIRTIYDWNWPPAGLCASQQYGLELEEPSAVQAAVVIMVGEKRFDPIMHTSLRAEECLRESQLELVAKVLSCKSRNDLVALASGLEYPESWFRDWKYLFAAVDGWVATADAVRLLEQHDPILGWTASSALRRSRLADEMQSRVRDILNNSDAAERVRWRAANTLGAFPCVENVEVLIVALASDPNHWVRYGAVRALMEIARKSDDQSLRKFLLERLRPVVSDLAHTQSQGRDRLLRELVHSAIAQPRQPDWLSSVGGFLLEVAGSMSATNRDKYVGLVNAELTRSK